MITPEHTKEALCLAHIHAVAATAGVNLSFDLFDYGVDGGFRRVVRQPWGWVPSGFGLDYQAKASVDWTLEHGSIVYDLDARAYNNIVSRSEGETTLILILLCLPPEQALWHVREADQVILRQGLFWDVFKGDPTANSSTKRVRIPIENRFDPDTLIALLEVEEARRTR